MKRLRAADLETGSLMALSIQPPEDRDADGHVTSQLQRLIQQVAYARSREHDAMTDALLQEAQALTTAVVQYEQTLHDAMVLLADLPREVSEFWERLADDRTLHDHVDDAGDSPALPEYLDRVQSRILTRATIRPSLDIT